MFKSKFSKKMYVIGLLSVFVLGIFLRTKVFLINQSFWHDECALAWNILNKSYVELLSPLRFLQMAPLGFLFSTKMLVSWFGNSENIFRLIPYLASLFSIVAFYYLSRELFKTKNALFFANFIFAICFPLYYYAAEFKSYSVDVLLCLLALLIFQKINNKNLIVNAILLSCFVWFSFSSAFILLSGIIVLFLDKKFDLKQKVYFSIPFLINFLILFSIYFLRNFSVTKGKMVAFWSDKFLTFNNFFHLFADWIEFLFSPSVLIPLLSIVGVIYFLKEKNNFIKISLTVISILILCSFFKIYPFYGRLILFLAPIFIIYYAKSIDKKNTIILILFLVSLIPQTFRMYEIFKKSEFYKYNPNPREMMLFIKINAKKNDIVYINNASNSDFLYYKQIYGLENNFIIENLSKIKKGDAVWFFVPNKEGEKLYKQVLLDYDIKYNNIAEKSFLIFGIKK